ncbi:MAG: DNA-primase RepB domain-containing protein [Thermosynechococcaceae cyanobacterium]
MSKPDFTYLAVRRQLQGMCATSYEVGVRDRTTGKMLPRTFKPEEVLKSVPWLKRQNAQDGDIYIRPQGSQGLILLDDLTHGGIERMKADGCNPAAIIETSPLNLQAWVRVSDTPIAQDLATAIAKHLATAFEADPNSADWRHYGRLAGFTNRKPEHIGGSGHSPYVKAHACNGKIAINASQLLSKAREALQATLPLKKRQDLSDEAVAAMMAVSLPCSTSLDPLTYYQRYLAGLIKEFGSNLDESRADWMIGKRMAMIGYAPEAIKQVIYEASPDLDSRKKGHVEDYVETTLYNLLCDEEVMDARQQLSLFSTAERS